MIPIKITIRRGDPAKNEPAMKYPDGHDPQIIDKLGIGMHYCQSQQLGDGDDVQYAITCVPRAYAEEYKRQAGDDVQFLTKSEAEDIFANDIDEPEEVINDRARLEMLSLKAQAGIALTAKEKEAFDPNSNEKGIIKNPRKGLANKLKKRKIDAEFDV